MGRPRSELHDILKGITENVYFQPPTTTKMEYPCIIYRRDFAKTEHADNSPYRFTLRYQVIAVSKRTDTDMFEKIAALPQSSFIRFYTGDDLNHDVFTLYF